MAAVRHHLQAGGCTVATAAQLRGQSVFPADGKVQSAADDVTSNLISVWDGTVEWPTVAIVAIVASTVKLYGPVMAAKLYSMYTVNTKVCVCYLLLEQASLTQSAVQTDLMVYI